MKTILRPEAMGTDKSVAVEDSIMLKDVICTAGSGILHNFVSPLTAAVADKLTDAGYVITGTAQMDEFGLDRVTPDRTETQCGAVESVASGEACFALGNDLSGKLRRQAAQAGLCYLHPTYGTVSRYGLIAAAASMDQIGVAAKTPSDAFELLSVIAGHDSRDGAMYPEESNTFSANGVMPIGEAGINAPNVTEAESAKAYNTSNSVGGVAAAKVYIPANLWEKALPEDKEAMTAFAAKFETEQMMLPYIEHYAAAQCILTSAEISNNISRFDGIKFGLRAENFRGLDELYTKSRTEGFDLEAKLCALLGCLVLSEEYYTPYYDKAMRMRRLIRDTLLRLLRSDNLSSDNLSSDNQISDRVVSGNQFLNGYNLLLLPARLNGTPFQQSAVYAPATLAGLPALSFPYEGGILQLIAAPKGESKLRCAWEVASR